MKPMKLEFVVFGISQENTVFLWKLLTRYIEFLGFDVTGKVSEITEMDFDVENVTQEKWEKWEKQLGVSKGGHAIIPGVQDTWDDCNDDKPEYFSDEYDD